MNSAQVSAARQLLHDAQRILVVSHIRPDGDAIGSLLGFGLAMLDVGKQVQMVSADGLPAAQRSLEGAELIRETVEGDFDCIVVVDCSDLKRAGTALENHPRIDLNIDHHITNEYFAAVNLVQPTAAATAEMLTELLPDLGFPIREQTARALLTGILTDTLGFRTSNTSAHTLRSAAGLIDQGANIARLHHLALGRRSFEAARYWGEGLTRLERIDRLVWTSLTSAARKAAAYPGRDDADLINFLASIQDADIAVIFVDQNNGHVKVSWRSQPGFDVSGIAVSFGGGGHPAAAGANVAGSLEEVQTTVLAATRTLLNLQAV
jgi:phosphoesterase RecJ-like protein